VCKSGCVRRFEVPGGALCAPSRVNRSHRVGKRQYRLGHCYKLNNNQLRQFVFFSYNFPYILPAAS
jgi:hypothetical protein